MQSTRGIAFMSRSFLVITVLCHSFFLSACQKKEQATDIRPATKQVELISQDIIQVKQGASSIQTPFTGTIRAINQSSIQSQVTATATQVYVEVGQTVQKGQILLRLNNQDNAARLAQNQANLSSAQAQADQAHNMLQRKKRLYDQGFISKVEYEQSQVDYKGQLENVKAQQANVNIAKKADQDGIIKSPITGVIIKRQVDAGQTVATGQTLFEILDPDHLEIQAKLPVDQQSALKVGRRIEYNIQGNTQKLSATLSRISPVADQVSRQIEFFATPNEKINSLSIGSFIDGKIIGDNQIQGQIVPLDTILDIKNKAYVWVIRDHKVQQVFIQVLDQRLSDNIAVVSGLNKGDLVSKVKLKPEDINKPVVISEK